jgi:hypothetical protein
MLMNEPAISLVAVGDEVTDISYAVTAIQSSPKVKKDSVEVVVSPFATGNALHSKVYVGLNHL